MASGIKLYQGADRDIVISHDDTDLTSATEIEFRIDCDPQITKTLTGGGIGGVTSSEFTVTIEDSDTANIDSKEYDFHVRSEKAGIWTQGEPNPKTVRVIYSSFTSTK